MHTHPHHCTGAAATRVAGLVTQVPANRVPLSIRALTIIGNGLGVLPDYYDHDQRDLNLEISSLTPINGKIADA